MKYVILNIAFEWTCPECNREQFAKAIRSFFASDEEERETKIALGIDPDDVEGAVVCAPVYVRCEVCKEEFKSFETLPE